MRVFSLVPGATEILCALGIAHQIVGISHDCDFPTDILNRPRLARTTLRSDLSQWMRRRHQGDQFEPSVAQIIR